MTTAKTKPGKIVGHSTYVHLDARDALSEEQRLRIAEAARLASVAPEVSFMRSYAGAWERVKNPVACPIFFCVR